MAALTNLTIKETRVFQALFFLSVLGFSSSACGLPSCSKDTSDIRHECFGGYTYGSGNKYIGEWRNNMKHGHGTFTYGPSAPSAGDQYIGDFRNDKRHGRGSYSYKTGDTYTGGFDDDKKEGHGTIIFSNGDKFIGTFLKGKRHGLGTYIWNNGSKFVGWFKNGKRWTGKTLDATGLITQTWENGILQP